MNLPQAGELRDLIDIISVAPPFPIVGKAQKTDTIAANVWAKIDPLGGGMDEENMQVFSVRQAYSIWIRRRPELSPFHQIEWGDRRLIITGPIEEFNNQWQLIHAEHRWDAAIS